MSMLTHEPMRDFIATHDFRSPPILCVGLPSSPTAYRPMAAANRMMLPRPVPSPAPGGHGRRIRIILAGRVWTPSPEQDLRGCHKFKGIPHGGRA